MISQSNSFQIKYEVDPHNRLVLKGTDKKTNLPKFRKVLSGRFKLDEDNNLTYLVRTPASSEEEIPHQVRLQGSWSLDEDHNLVITFDKWERETFGEKITLQGQITDVDKNSLDFSLTGYEKEGESSRRVLTLGGAWQADKRNRLNFRVRREKGQHDILTFTGTWQIDNRHRIVYRHEQASLIRKKRTSSSLVFRGHWDIRGKKRLAYVLDKSTGSEFSFSVSFAQFKKNYIKYRIGIEVGEKGLPAERTLTLFGRWQILKDLGLLFEVDRRDRRPQAISFGAEAKLTGRNTLSFKLKDEKGRDLGGELKLSHDLLGGDGEAFLKFLKRQDEQAVLIGAGFRW
jgi:hypothetical protein